MIDEKDDRSNGWIGRTMKAKQDFEKRAGHAASDLPVRHIAGALRGALRSELEGGTFPPADRVEPFERKLTSP
jgi:hypothetical protein